MRCEVAIMGDAGSVRDEIGRQCEAIFQLLIEKNRKYGNSALDPLRVFSRASTEEQIRVRIDDKLSRIRSRQSDDSQDTELDLIGYLILLRVQRALQSVT